MAVGFDFEGRIDIDDELTKMLEVAKIQDGRVFMELHEELVALKHSLKDYLPNFISAIAEGLLFGICVNTKTEAFKTWIRKPANAAIEGCILTENIVKVSDTEHYRYLPIFAVIDEGHCSVIWSHPMVAAGKTQFGTQLTNLVEWWGTEAMIELHLRWNLKKWKDMQTQTDPEEQTQTDPEDNNQE